MMGSARTRLLSQLIEQRNNISYEEGKYIEKRRVVTLPLEDAVENQC